MPARFGPFALIQLDIAHALDPHDEAVKVRVCASAIVSDP